MSDRLKNFIFKSKEDKKVMAEFLENFAQKGPPYHFRDEKSGKLAGIIHRFYYDEKLSTAELELLKWYVIQYVAAIPAAPYDFMKMTVMQQFEFKDYVLVDLAKLGIDPF